MQGARVAGEFFEHKGPLVFSGSLHLVLILVIAAWALISPKKEPEDFRFELTQTLPYSSLDTAAIQSLAMTPRLPSKQSADSQSEPVDVVEPQQRKISSEEFFRKHPELARRKNIPPTSTVDQRPARIHSPSIGSFAVDRVVIDRIQAGPVGNASALNEYIARFKDVVQGQVGNHALVGKKLSVSVECDISGSGMVSNIRVLRASGDPLFDQKVLHAYRSVSRFGAPPDGAFTLRLTFLQQ